VKIIRIGVFGLGLCAAAWAQQLVSDDLQQIDPATGKPATAQAEAAPPPLPAQPAPPAPADPQQTPPATPQEPMAPTSGPNIQVAPELPKYPDVRLPGETGWSVGVLVWTPRQQPIFNRGTAAIFPQASLVTMQGTPKFSQGAEVGIAVGQHNAIRVSWFTTRAAGDFTNAEDLTLFNQTYSAGTLISTNYNVQNIKLSFDYLTWPYPVESRRFRLLTLWQVQYTSARAGFDAPQLPLVDANGNPLVDASGNPLSYATQQTRWFISPTFGIGAHEYVTKDFRVEVNVDGFTIPHHWTIWDTDADLNYRVGHLEVRAGVKGFHFKTSTSSDFFMKSTFFAPMVGLRWYTD
jgi:hypothetical protein